MRIVILGGAGLISSHITQQLLARGDDVWHFNRGQRAAGFGDISFCGPIHTIVGDRAQAARFEAQMRNAPMFDCVIDMIGYGPADVESDLRAFAGRCGHLIFCSTVDVYAHPHPQGALPYREDAPQAGRNAYAANKMACEAILSAASQRGDLNVTIIRPAYTYAEGALILDSLGWRATYLDRLRKGKPIIVHGDGQSLWCACHAQDVARAFVNAAGNPVAFGKSYHTAGEEFLTWNQYHEMVAQAIGAPPPTLVHIPTDVLARALPSGQMSDAAHWTLTNFQFNNIFDNAAARRDLGFRYAIPWAAGAKRLADWLAAHDQIANSDDDSTPDALRDDALIAMWEQVCTRMTRAHRA